MKRFWVSLIVSFSLVMIAIPASVQAFQLVSSEGNKVTISETEAAGGGNFSSAFSGRGGTEREALRTESVITESAPMSELMALKPMTAEVGIESVLGFDSRVQTYTNRFPQRAVGLITFGSSRCTGWLIGANTVVTAGHCVARGGSRTFYSPSLYRFYPGRNGNSSPYGYCTARTLWSNTTWLNTGNDAYDWGLIKLNCTVGNSTGWFGYFFTTRSLLNEVSVISGYPGDKPLTQWESVDKVRVDQAMRSFYKNDTIGGMSGSPVWADRPTGGATPTNGAYAMAVHAYGIYNGSPFSTHNHGTRITQSVFNSFSTVKNMP